MAGAVATRALRMAAQTLVLRFVGHYREGTPVLPSITSILTGVINRWSAKTERLRPPLSLPIHRPPLILEVHARATRVEPAALLAESRSGLSRGDVRSWREESRWEP